MAEKTIPGYISVKIRNKMNKAEHRATIRVSSIRAIIDAIDDGVVSIDIDQDTGFATNESFDSIVEKIIAANAEF